MDKHNIGSAFLLHSYK